MHHFPYPSYLRTHRKKWALSQPELSLLLGFKSPNIISKYELLQRDPTVEALIGAQFIFDEPARRLFPALYAGVELGIVQRAATLAESIAARGDKKSLRKRELLEAIARHAADDTYGAV